MYTLHHGFWIYFFTRHHPKVWQFVVGSMLPDYIYIVLVATSLLKGYVSFSEITGITPGILTSLVAIFPWAVKIDLLGHSVPVWSSALLLSFLPGLKKVQAFVIGWGTHLLIDGLTHSAYSNFYLYPLLPATVISPVSYWEHNYWSPEFRITNIILMTLAGVYMVYEWWKIRKA